MVLLGVGTRWGAHSTQGLRRSCFMVSPDAMVWVSLLRQYFAAGGPQQMRECDRIFSVF